MVLRHYDLFNSQHLPDKVYVAVVDQQAFNGMSTMNSFNFQMSNMQRAFLTVNQDIVPDPPYEYNLSDNQNMCYRTFLENTGTGPFELDTVDINNEEWKKTSVCMPLIGVPPLTMDCIITTPPQTRCT